MSYQWIRTAGGQNQLHITIDNLLNPDQTNLIEVAQNSLMAADVRMRQFQERVNYLEAMCRQLQARCQQLEFLIKRYNQSGMHEVNLQLIRELEQERAKTATLLRQNQDQENAIKTLGIYGNIINDAHHDQTSQINMNNYFQEDAGKDSVALPPSSQAQEEQNCYVDNISPHASQHQDVAPNIHNPTNEQSSASMSPLIQAAQTPQTPQPELEEVHGQVNMQAPLSEQLQSSSGQIPHNEELPTLTPEKSKDKKKSDKDENLTKKRSASVAVAEDNECVKENQKKIRPKKN